MYSFFARCLMLIWFFSCCSFLQHSILSYFFRQFSTHKYIHAANFRNIFSHFQFLLVLWSLFWSIQFGTLFSFNPIFSLLFKMLFRVIFFHFAFIFSSTSQPLGRPWIFSNACHSNRRNRLSLSWTTGAKTLNEIWLWIVQWLHSTFIVLYTHAHTLTHSP